MGTIAQELKDGIPISAIPIVPSDRSAMVADGTAFVKEPNPIVNVKNIGEVVNALGGVTGAVNVDLTLGNVVSATVTGAVVWSFINPKMVGFSCAFTLILTDGAAGAQTWPASVKWPGGVAPVLSANVDIIVFTTMDGGATWYGSQGGSSFLVPPPVSTAGLFTWGNNGDGQLGIGTSGIGTYRSSPVQVGSDTDWTSVAFGQFFATGIRSGKLFTWGKNDRGQLGLDDIVSRSSPVQVGAATDWSVVSDGNEFSGGIRSGKLFTWGRNAFGDLGLGLDPGTTLAISSPVQVGAATDWSDVALGLQHAHGIRGGKLFAWGGNGAGVLGLGYDPGAIYGVSSPVQVGADTDWALVSGSSDCAAGIRSGKLFMWGSNGYGQLGLGVDPGTTLAISSPIQVGADSDWTAVSCGRLHTIGIRSGQLFVWGKNDYGQLGIGDIVNRSSPVQVGSATDWTAVSGMYAASSGRRSGRLFTWGGNDYGELGTGTFGPYARVSSPVQVGARTNWTDAKGTTGVAGVRV